MSGMSSGRRPGPDRYEIRVGGHLGPRWATWFDGMDLAAGDDGTTVLTGPVVDQAELHGLLQKVRDLGLPLLSVTRVGADRPAVPTAPTSLTPATTSDRPDRRPT